MSTAHQAQELIARRVRKGNDPGQSSALLAELLRRHAGDNLEAALVYHSFATEKGAERFVNAIGETA